MRRQTYDFLLKFFRDRYAPKSVLDVGSAHVNGDLRDIFNKAESEYIGLDMRKVRNVDIVLNAHDIDKHFKEGEFDMVCCFDTLEHDDKFWLSFSNMKWVLSKGGYLLIGVPGRACPQHDQPNDYWRFMKDGVISLFEGFEDVHVEVQKDNPNNDAEDEIYAWGKKI